MKICPECNNQLYYQHCKLCGKSKQDYDFDEHCRKLRFQFLEHTWKLLKKFKMESTGVATLDLAILDRLGPWVNRLPEENPLREFYIARFVGHQLSVLFRELKVNHTQFVATYQNYLNNRKAVAEDKFNY